MNVQQISSGELSHFKTSHWFEAYAEFESVEQFLELSRWAKEQGRRVFILGNGSNTLFLRKRVRSLVLLNRLPTFMKELPEHRWEISSANQVSDVLRFCRGRSLDSFYYLASVPATIGGAVAMNAGRGASHNLSIFDYIEAVKYVEDGVLRESPADRLARGYRKTPFTGLHSSLIVSAVFRFPPTTLGEDPIVKRLLFVKAEQDNSGPNCGSVFSKMDLRIMTRLRGLKIGRAFYSRKTSNWILNYSPSPWPIRILILVARVLHRVCRRPIHVELIEVD